MPVKAYRNQSFKTTHENRIFDDLFRELKRVFGPEEVEVALLGNFYCSGAEIDAAILMRDSITVVDFKNYGGRISFSENGPWMADKVEVRGGNKRNPYLQIRDNKFCLLNKLKTLGLPSGRSPELGHISGMVLFHQPIEFEDRQLPNNVKPWLHVVDFEQATERLSQITSTKIDLTAEDIQFIAQSFDLNSYQPVGVKPATPAPIVEGTNAVSLPECLLSASRDVGTFLESDSPVLVIGGMIGTGKSLLMEKIIEQTTSKALNCLVLAPNSRMANTYTVEADSIYSHIFKTNSKSEDGRLVHEVDSNGDADDMVYLVGDGHLVSDSKFETDSLRFGTGHLLSDLINFVATDKTARKIVFIGDPFQITRGKVDETAFSSSRMNAILGVEIKRMDLDHLRPGVESDPFVANCLPLAQSMNNGSFNRLEIQLEDPACLKVPDDQESKRKLITSLFLEHSGCKFIAFSHRTVNATNAWVRKAIYHRTSEALSSGDIVHIHNGFFAKTGDDSSPPVLVPHDSFAEVISVHEKESITQELRGRDAPIEIHFLNVKVRLASSQVVSFLALRDFLYAEKPELDPDTLLALRVFAETKFRHSNNPDIELTKFLQNDRHFNAAHLRFGYALTLHRAQGRTFDFVIADCNTGQGQTNETYFRWLYTLFTIPSNAIHLVNVPNITPLNRAKWKEGKVGTVKSSNLIAYDPDAPATMPADIDIEIKDPQLVALFVYLQRALFEMQSEVYSVEAHQYQQVYRIRNKDGACCELRMTYNGKYHVTKIQPKKSRPSDFADKVLGKIQAGVLLEDDQQIRIHQMLEGRLSEAGITIQSIEHKNFQEIYFLNGTPGKMKLQIFYDGEGFLTNFCPVVYSSEEMLVCVRDCLGFGDETQ